MPIAPETVLNNTMSAELTALLEQLKIKRDSHDDWLAMEYAISQRISACKATETVWCKGEVHGPERHYPAVVIFDRETNGLKVLTPSGEDLSFEEQPYNLFSSRIPYIAIQRSLADEGENGTI